MVDEVEMRDLRTPGTPRTHHHPLITFVKKYFCEGQRTHKTVPKAGVDRRPGLRGWLDGNRRLVGLGAPALLCHVLWWPLAVRWDLFALYPSRWPIALTMVFGAMVAGATSEGGGAVAFPVMTMAFKILPSVARDFSLVIQTCGMSAASLAILLMGIRLEYASLLFSSIGAVFGLVFGLEVLDPLISPPAKKMGFVSVFFSFAIALFLLNRRRKRTVFDAIPDLNHWRVGVLVASGFLGGTMTGIVGSGVDILSFSLLTLLFSVSEKVATPTSVVLMAINTSVGAYWRLCIQTGVSREALEYVAVCVPIVVICAPLGSLVASHFHRQVLAGMIYVLETVALVSAFAIIRPSAWLAAGSVGLMAAASAAFFGLSLLGRRLLPDQARPNPSTASVLALTADSAQTKLDV